MENKDITVRSVESQDEWNRFVIGASDDTFHQSWEWGDIYTSLGSQVHHLGLFSGDDMVGAALTIKVTAKRGSFLLVPHGPLFSPQLVEDKKLFQKSLGFLLKELKGLAIQNNCTFIRLAPTFQRTEENTMIFRALGFRKAPMFVQSELSWRLLLDKSEQELLADMRKSTRYILKRADSYGVSFDQSTDPVDFDRFYALYNSTVKQQEFVGQSKEFIRQEFSSFSKNGKARFYFAKSGSTDLAAAMIITQGKSGFYHYGASRKDEKNTPAPHLLQWHIIKDLRSGGFLYYNFWGISPDEKPNHPWRGLTIFKKGFGGEELVYLQTQDYILKWSYWLSWVVETIRRIKRHY